MIGVNDFVSVTLTGTGARILNASKWRERDFYPGERFKTQLHGRNAYALMRGAKKRQSLGGTRVTHVLPEVIAGTERAIS